MAAAVVAGAGAGAARAVCCHRSTTIGKKGTPIPRIQAADPSPAGAKIVLQPRLSNLRSYGDGSPQADFDFGSAGSDASESSFFSSLAEYLDNSRKSRDFETLSGRLAMVAFAGAVGVELVTGNSLFGKLESEKIEKAAALCAMVVAMSATFAWVTSEKVKIGQMFTAGCNNFVDGLIDDLVDGLFYEDDLYDRVDDDLCE